MKSKTLRASYHSHHSIRAISKTRVQTVFTPLLQIQLNNRNRNIWFDHRQIECQRLPRCFFNRCLPLMYALEPDFGCIMKQLGVFDFSGIPIEMQLAHRPVEDMDIQAVRFRIIGQQAVIRRCKLIGSLSTAVDRAPVHSHPPAGAVETDLFELPVGPKPYPLPVG